MVAFNESPRADEELRDVDLRITHIPERSALYRLKPLGVGTGLVESLWSYLVRLADAHAVRLHDFYWAVLAPVAKITRPRCSKVALVPLKGERTEKIVAAVETLAMRTGLVRTTLIRGEENSGILVTTKKHREWCAGCLASDVVPYDRLVWSISDVTHCSVHRIRFMDRCPSCRRRQIPTAVGVSIVHCSYCGASLTGTAGDGPLLVDDYQVWTASETAALVLAMDQQKLNPGMLTHNLRVTKTVCGGHKPFARLLQVALNSVLAWERYDNCMRLQVALRWAWVTNVPIGDLLGREIAASEIKIRASRSEWRPQARPVFKTRSSDDYLQALAGFLAKHPYAIPTKRMLIQEVGGHRKHPALNALVVRRALESSKRLRKRLRYKQRVWAIVCREYHAFVRLEKSGAALNSRNLCSLLGRGGDMVSPLARNYFTVLQQQHARGQLMPDPNKRVPQDVREFWAHHGLT